MVVSNKLTHIHRLNSNSCNVLNIKMPRYDIIIYKLILFMFGNFSSFIRNVYMDRIHIQLNRWHTHLFLSSYISNEWKVVCFCFIERKTNWKLRKRKQKFFVEFVKRKIVPATRSEKNNMPVKKMRIYYHMIFPCNCYAQFKREKDK